MDVDVAQRESSSIKRYASAFSNILISKPYTSGTENRRSSNQAPSMDDVNTNPSSPYFIPPSDVVLVSQR